MIRHSFIVGPILTVVYSYLLYKQIGWVSFFAPLLIVLISIFQIWINKLVFKIQRQRLKIAGSRANQVSEIVNGIKVIKFNTWENFIIEKISKIRLSEKNFVFKYFLAKNFAKLTEYLVPYVLTFLCFWVYQAYVDDLNVTKVFSVLSIFQNLFFPISMFFLAYNARTQSLVSSDRVDKLLKLEDFVPLEDDLKLEKGELMIENGEFSWGNPEFEKIFKKADEKSEISKEPVLTNLNFKLEKNEFVAVIGSVGQGKTSFLLALMNELHKIQGKLSKNGSIAFIPQESFLLNDTIKQNILFGNDDDQARYRKIVEKCELIPDLKILPGGDMTQIGERGINISGG